MNTELKHDIYIDWELAGTNPYKPLLTRVITAALAAENVEIPCSVDVLLTTDEGIREINQEQRNIDQATDVLSFPMLELTPGTPPDGTGEDEQDPETGLCPLGDMVISVDRAKAQAAEFGHSVERESGIIDLHVTIYCEKASHKGIIIGKQGSMLKKISTMAREDVERFMGTKVYLETWVKVKENWRDNLNLIRSFGFDERD